MIKKNHMKAHMIDHMIFSLVIIANEQLKVEVAYHTTTREMRRKRLDSLVAAFTRDDDVFSARSSSVYIYTFSLPLSPSVHCSSSSSQGFSRLLIAKREAPLNALRSMREV